nr:hypothetical protein [Chitinimonas viridis]
MISLQGVVLGQPVIKQLGQFQRQAQQDIASAAGTCCLAGL